MASIREIREAMAHQTALDKLISYVSPERGLKRMQARGMQAAVGSWHGGSQTRRAMSEWNPSLGSADEDILWDLDEMRVRSRDALRNAPIASGAVNVVVTNAVGTGLSLHSRIDRVRIGLTDEEADALQGEIEREWCLFADSPECDVTRQQDFYQLTSLVFRSVLESGDAFTLLPMVKRAGVTYSLKIQVIEADRVSNPNGQRSTDAFAAGVEMDSYGAPVRYHISTAHPGGISRAAMQWTAIPAYNARGVRQVLHHFDRRRPGQTRGFPYLAPILEPLKQLERYTDAELMAAVVSGMFTIFVTSENGGGIGPFGMAGETGATASDTDLKMGNGAIVGLRPGESISTADPGRPNSEFDPFTTSIIKQIGMALELPYEVLTKRYEASFSAARGAIMDAWRFFKTRREFIASSFCQPVFEAWMDEAVARGRINAPGYFQDPDIRRAYCGARWTGDAPAQIDPVKEVTAAEKRMALHLTTLAEETVAMTGGNWEENLPQEAKENKEKIRLGIGQPGPVATPPVQPDPEEDPEDPPQQKEDSDEAR